MTSVLNGTNKLRVDNIIMMIEDELCVVLKPYFIQHDIVKVPGKPVEYKAID